MAHLIHLYVVPYLSLVVKKNLSSGFLLVLTRPSLPSQKKLILNLETRGIMPHSSVKTVYKTVADQTAQMPRLICACVVCISNMTKAGFLTTWLIWCCKACSSINFSNEPRVGSSNVMMHYEFLLEKCKNLLQCKRFSHFFNKIYQCISNINI